MKSNVNSINNDLLSPSQVAVRLGVSTRTVQRYIQSGMLRAFRMNKYYKIRESDLQEFYETFMTPVSIDNEVKEN